MASRTSVVRSWAISMPTVSVVAVTNKRDGQQASRCAQMCTTWIPVNRARCMLVAGHQGPRSLAALMDGRRSEGELSRGLTHEPVLAEGITGLGDVPRVWVAPRWSSRTAAGGRGRERVEGDVVTCPAGPATRGALVLPPGRARRAPLRATRCCGWGRDPAGARGEEPGRPARLRSPRGHRNGSFE